MKSSQKKSTAVSGPTLEEVMDELQSRFLVNLPATEFASGDRLFFQIEQCYWFYEDFYADEHGHLPHLRLPEFADRMFAHCPLLQPLAPRCQDLFADFKAYQSQVPVVGCIMANAAGTKVLLVRNWRGTSWSFPRGKVNEGETDRECARREVLEECGFDVQDHVQDGLFLDFAQKQQRVRMFLAKGVPEDFSFAPQTRKEISLVQWFDVDNLPKKTWCVLPFMARVRRWLTKQKKSKAEKRKKKNDAYSTPTKKTPPTSSASTPQSGRRTRGHFGTEAETFTSSDVVNSETFGDAKGFSVDEMFKVNERLTGVKFEYDGNPNDFGKRPEVPVQMLRRESAKANESSTFRFDTKEIMAVMT